MISAMVNDKKIDYRDDYAGALRDLISFHLYNARYQEVTHAKSNIKEQLEQYLEFIELEKESADKQTKVILSALKRKISSFISVIKYYKTIDVFIVNLYEMILSLDKLGLLRGFGFSNMWGDALKGNSEKISLRKQ